MNLRNKLSVGAGLLGGIALCAILALAFAVPALAADSNKRLFDREQLQITTGTATVNSATADYSAWQPLVTVTPSPDNANALEGVFVAFDLDQATTGFHAVYTSATITFTLQRKVDGTNWRTCANLATATVSGTNAATASVELAPGLVSPGESLRIAIKISSVSNTNITIPFVVYYRAAVKATITAAS